MITKIRFLACLAWLAAASARAGETTRVSVDSGGSQGSNHSFCHSISSDGRYIAFSSDAPNLVPGDTNGVRDVFRHDSLTGQTTRVSVDSGGNQGNSATHAPSISADARYVAFFSGANNLVPGDTNGVWDVFVHDSATGQTTRISVDSSGNEGNDVSELPSISADGRYVAFYSLATDLVSGDTNGHPDVFLHDRTSGVTTRASVDSNGSEGNGTSTFPSISPDGRYVAFSSEAINLVPGDTNGEDDVFVHDRTTGQVVRVSVDSSGNQGNDGSFGASISSDGRYVAFHSYASNLVPGDTNGNLDVFVHDRVTGQTTRVSVDSNGNQVGVGGWNPSISSDGRYVAFSSQSSALVPGDANGLQDVFLHDRTTGQTIRVSVSSSGNEAIGGSSQHASIAADGRRVAFDSFAANLVPGDTNGSLDAFVHERLVGTLYCFGDGSGTTCPCSNTGGSSEGCSNSTGMGAEGIATGSSSVATDDLGFGAIHLLPMQPALLFVGDNALNNGNGVHFGDGLRCAGGNVVRIGVKSANSAGGANWGPGLGATGGWSPGEVKRFQVWYRDPNASPCGSTFNLSNGVEVSFDP